MSIGLRVKFQLFLSVLRKLEFTRQIYLVSNYMEIRVLGAELFRADRQTDICEKVNNRFSQYSDRVQKVVLSHQSCCVMVHYRTGDH
jgi:trehalose-6-phosphatase